MEGAARTIRDVNTLWNELAARANVTLHDDQHDLLGEFLDLLIDANKRMNLTRITNREDAEIQHIGDALTLLPFLPAGPIKVADIGSGGGVPGIPLAIARPDAKFTLVESTSKKANYLRDVIKQLDLPNVFIHNSRAELLARTAMREGYDIVTARAVGSTAWLAEWCLPLARLNGKVLAMKGAKIAEELPEATNAIHMLGGREPTVHPVQLPGAEHHVILQILKRAPTSPKYPRDPTATGGKPLG